MTMSPLSYATVKIWATLFKVGRESVDDDSGSGCRASAVTNVEKFVMKDWRVSVQHIASETSVSIWSVETIFHDRLNLFNASAR